MIESFWDLLTHYEVSIPKIQRDYAQGRTKGKVPVIRENLLNAIFTAISQPGEVLELDFVYGYTKGSAERNENVTFYPLDGQQRLTTLFLLHWYAAAKEGKLEEVREVLSRFTYETRHSSDVFCSELVKYIPEGFQKPLIEEIENQPWFFTAWNNDPTIRSMLVMLEAIHRKAEEFSLVDIWARLTSDRPAILFHILFSDEMGLADELYIKMNSRGKELTEFEHFKGKFSELLPEDAQSIFNEKIDKDWSDLFWDLYKIEEKAEDEREDIARKVDEGFLKFFRYITDIILYESQERTDDIEKEYGLFHLMETVYENGNNVWRFINIMDILTELYREEPKFFGNLLYVHPSEYELEKVQIYFAQPSVDLFKKCADVYDPEERNNPFSIGEQLLLYALIVHKLESTLEISKRIRMVRNLIENSEDMIRKENMDVLLDSVYKIIKTGVIPEDSRFNKAQVDDEIRKEEFLSAHSQLTGTIRKLEDHYLLRGCLALFDLADGIQEIANKFAEVFSAQEDFLLISRALFTLGDYSQLAVWRRLIGHRKEAAWRDLFTPSIRRKNFRETKLVLMRLLEGMIKDDSVSLQSIIDDYLTEYIRQPEKEKDWVYYYIKWSGFHRHEEGIYHWPNQSKPYEVLMLRKRGMNGFHWNPFHYSVYEERKEKLQFGNWNHALDYYKNGISIKIMCRDKFWVYTPLDDDSKAPISKMQERGLLDSENKYWIKQSPDGLDIEDRVDKAIWLIDEIDKMI